MRREIKSHVPGAVTQGKPGRPGLGGQRAQAVRLGLVEVTHENVTVFLTGDCGVRQGSVWKVEATQGI